MINDVRNTVLSVLSKDNNGYITPEQFNLYAKQAQMEIFEQYFYEYSNATNKRNLHRHTTGLGDIPKRIAEVINRFRGSGVLTYDAGSLNFNLPIDTVTGLPIPIYSLGVVSTDAGNEIECVQQNDILRLNSSLDTAPTLTYPVYTMIGDEIRVYPSSIDGTTTSVLIDYIRFPKEPKWTYTMISSEPVFNGSASDYQDFELEPDDEMNLVLKILSYAGVQIGDFNLAKAAKGDEIQEIQLQK